MQVVITAVGPDNRGLADPIIHHVTGLGANIAEIQMYDHDEQSLFAMLLRIELPAEQSGRRCEPQLAEIGRLKGLSIRVWSPDERRRPPAAGDLHDVSPRAGAGAAAGDSRRPGARPRRP